MTFARTQDAAYNATVSEIDELGIQENLLELDTLGYTTLRGVLSEDQVATARDVI